MNHGLLAGWLVGAYRQTYIYMAPTVLGHEKAVRSMFVDMYICTYTTSFYA